MAARGPAPTLTYFGAMDDTSGKDLDHGRCGASFCAHICQKLLHSEIISSIASSVCGTGAPKSSNLFARI